VPGRESNPHGLAATNFKSVRRILPDLTKWDEPIFAGLAAVKGHASSGYVLRHKSSSVASSARSISVVDDLLHVGDKGNALRVTIAKATLVEQKDRPQASALQRELVVPLLSRVRTRIVKFNNPAVRERFAFHNVSYLTVQFPTVAST